MSNACPARPDWGIGFRSHHTTYRIGLVDDQSEQTGVASQVQGPASIAADAADDRRPVRAVSFDPPMLQLDPCPGRTVGDEPDLDLAGVGRVALQLPSRPDVPAEQQVIGRFEGEHPGPPADLTVRATVVDVTSDARLEDRLRDRHGQQVVIVRLDVVEPGDEHVECRLDRRIDRHCLADDGVEVVVGVAHLAPYSSSSMFEVSVVGFRCRVVAAVRAAPAVTVDATTSTYLASARCQKLSNSSRSAATPPGSTR